MKQSVNEISFDKLIAKANGRWVPVECRGNYFPGFRENIRYLILTVESQRNLSDCMSALK